MRNSLTLHPSVGTVVSDKDIVWISMLHAFKGFLPAGCVQSTCWLVLRLLYVFRMFVCILAYASELLKCPIITSRKLLPCNDTLINLIAALSTGVATMSSLAHFRAQDTEAQKQRQPQKQAATCDVLSP